MAILTAVPAPATRARAASSLVTLAGGGLLTDADLLSLGHVILGRDLDATRWPLPGIGMVHLRPGTMAGILRSALDSAFKPQTVRLGKRWITDGAGRKDRTVIPADLDPRDLAGWLRAECCKGARAVVTGRLGDLRERKAPRKYRPVAIDLVSEHARHAALGPESALLIREALAQVLDQVEGRERDAVVLILDGHSPQEAAQRLGVTDRTVRRYLQRLRERVTKTGIMDGLASPWLALVCGGETHRRCSVPAEAA